MGIGSMRSEMVSVLTSVFLLFSGLSYANEDITLRLPGGVQMEFVWIDPGTFVMGSAETEPNRGDNEIPQHQVTISQGFYLGRYELTQGQWESVMGTRPWAGQERVVENPNHPAVYISWTDVQELVHRMNQAAGDSLYRLPREAEWEYACRAGTTTRWSFGDDVSQVKDYAWYRANARDAGLQYAQAVGTKLPNRWGLFDMHGNVWEWVQDWYGGFSDSPQTDPTGPAHSDFRIYRVFRGGDWYFDAYSTRSASRGYNEPDYRYSPSFGTRLVRMGSGIPMPTPVIPQTWGQTKSQMFR